MQTAFQTPFKNQETVNSFKEKNAQLACASPAQVRVMIAKDALAQIKAGITLPTEGTYLCAVNTRWDGYGLRSAYTTTEVCHACAKGALFLAKARREQTTIDPSFCGEPDYMEEWPEENWELIEAAFEGSEIDSPSLGTEDDRVRWHKSLERAFDFYGRYKTDKSRLVAILNNIIANDGLFVP